MTDAEKREYPLTLAGAVRVWPFPTTAVQVTKWSEADPSSADYLPHIAHPGDDGKIRRHYRQSDIDAWIDRHMAHQSA